jgi:hypothetical protein
MKVGTRVPTLVRDDGTPIAKPRRAEFETDLDYVQAFHRYRDEITKLANTAFDETFFRAIMRG